MRSQQNFFSWGLECNCTYTEPLPATFLPCQPSTLIGSTWLSMSSVTLRDSGAGLGFFRWGWGPSGICEPTFWNGNQKYVCMCLYPISPEWVHKASSKIRWLHNKGQEQLCPLHVTVLSVHIYKGEYWLKVQAACWLAGNREIVLSTPGVKIFFIFKC